MFSPAVRNVKVKLYKFKVINPNCIFLAKVKRYELSFLMFFFSRSLNMKITVNLCGVWNWLIHSYTKKYVNICDKNFFIISQTSIRKHQFSLEQSIILMPPFLGNFFFNHLATLYILRRFRSLYQSSVKAFNSYMLKNNVYLDLS